MDLYYKVENECNLKEILKGEFGISSRLFLKLKNEKHIFVNGSPTFYDYNLKLNDIVEVDLDFEEDNSNIEAVKMELDILYEDKYMLVINKPPFLPVHPSMRHFSDNLSSGVKYYFDTISLHRKIRIVNRLDKDTSGIVIFAKNEYIQEALISQMKSNIFYKEYLGIVSGHFKDKNGIIKAPIARKQGSIIERCVSSEGQEAITYYEIIKELDNFSLARFVLKTGRTHQIRVHSAYVGHPLLR